MSVIENYISGTVVVFTFIVGIIFTFYLPKVRSAVKAYQNAGDILRDMIGELRNRQKNQDIRISDHQIQIEILESQLKQIINKNHLGQMNVSDNIFASNVKSNLSNFNDISHKSQESHIQEVRNSEMLGETELLILKELSLRSLLANEVQVKIKKSREHTGRILKKLFELKLLKRGVGERPFRYYLSEEGRNLIN